MKSANIGHANANYKNSISGSNGNPMMSSTEASNSHVFAATDGMQIGTEKKMATYSQGQ